MVARFDVNIVYKLVTAATVYVVPDSIALISVINKLSWYTIHTKFI
jgi:hypothetical protein